VLPNALELGERYFERGSYAQAAVELESYLEEESESVDRDRALFKLALSHALAGGARSPEPYPLLERLVHDYPTSRYAPEAQLILQLRAEVERWRGESARKDETIHKLNEQLEKLKQIDIRKPRSQPAG
jgi:hypothetical protein